MLIERQADWNPSLNLHPLSAPLRLAGNAAAAKAALSVVIPCYNEAPALGELYRRVSAVCRATFPDDHEIVLINDGSRDATWAGICALADQDSAVVGVNLGRNHGHQLALTAGLKVCGGDIILIMDADLQDPPELLPSMLGLMKQGADVVYGQRESREGETLFKRSTAALFYRLVQRRVEIDIPMDTGDFRLMSRRALDVLNAMPEQHRFIRGMVSWIGLKQVPLLYRRQSRIAGETKYPLSKMVRFAADAITGFSIRPLRAASWLGVGSGSLGILLLVYAIYSFVTDHTVAGWTSLITVVTLLGSAQLFVLGIIGEYLGRLYMEAKHRPLFVSDRIYQAPAQRGAGVDARQPEEIAVCVAAA